MLGFSPELEEEYRADRAPRDAAAVRLAATAALLLHLVFAAFSWGMFGRLSIPGQKIYFLWLVPGLALWLASTYRHWAVCRLRLVTAGVCALVLGAGHAAFAWADPQNFPLFQPAAGVFFVMFIYGNLRLPFLWATATGWLYSVVLLAAYASCPSVDWLRAGVAAWFLLCTNVLGMFVAYLLEWMARRDFSNVREIAAERAISDKLLLNILPEPIAKRLKQGHDVIADSFPETTILFADIVGYTQLSAKTPPEELVSILNEVFSRFDAVADRLGLEKIKTIGDAYMAVCGLPEPRADHTGVAAEAALAMLGEVRAVNAARGLSLDVRIGIHSGPVVAGVIGVRKFSYDLWGDSVNVASRMESHGAPGSIQASESVFARIGDKFHMEPRGVIEVKGRGKMPTYWLKGKR
ncbi:MAG TPA: adenylate/guanylate cyclase domain-containing protein [Elusimicrobiota bacterium]|nr:adenylate/guanylate cyclase domain-containing protein [Elusimicrobiota bacterium]